MISVCLTPRVSKESQKVTVFDGGIITSNRYQEAIVLPVIVCQEAVVLPVIAAKRR